MSSSGVRLLSGEFDGSHKRLDAMMASSSLRCLCKKHVPDSVLGAAAVAGHHRASNVGPPLISSLTKKAAQGSLDGLLSSLSNSWEGDYQCGD
jgi:hypothetical protein